MEKSSENKKAINSKRLITIFLSLAVVFSAAAVIIHFTTRATNDSYIGCRVGDINGDGKVDTADALLAIKYVSMDVDLYESQIENGDVNNDSKLNSVDALIILRYCVGEVAALPYRAPLATQPTTTPEPTTQADSGSNITVDANVVSSRTTESGATAYTINITAKNPTDNEVGGWQTILTFNEEVYVSSESNCRTKENGNDVIIYGQSIESGSEAEAEIIVRGSSELKLNTVGQASVQD